MQHHVDNYLSNSGAVWYGEIFMNDAVRELAQVLEPDAEVNAKLAPYARAGVGGPVDILYIARSREDLIRAVTTAQTLEVPWRVYGGLTNVLLPDSGFPAAEHREYMVWYPT